jgi:uncharacterized protein YdgA (DUF945 family)|tara:strand:+ start:2184 stop:2369 length:186 start_codon:yes stop_codon:yes gene_type:complete
MEASMKIKVIAIIDTGDDNDNVVYDGLSMENSVGLLGTVIDYNVKYNIKETELSNEDKKED